MTNPIEVLFSIYLVPRPPFVARLLRKEISLSDRVTMLCYSKASGKLVKCDLTKKRRRIFDVVDGDNIRAITIIDPNAELNSILSTPDSESIVYYSGYQWKWTPDYKFLRVYDGASAFYLTAEEALRIKEKTQAHD